MLWEASDRICGKRPESLMPTLVEAMERHGHLQLGPEIRAGMNTRCLVSALERPVGASSGHNRGWHGCALHGPKMLEKYLTIFRTTHNFVFVGSDGQAPAMRLSIKKRPMTFKEILRAEQPTSASRGAGTKRVVKGWK